MKKLFIMAAIAGLVFQLSACGKNVEGKYVSASKDTWIKTINLENGKANLDGIVFPYEAKGNKVYITDPSRGAVEFEVVDSETIKSDMFGTYKKKK